jgi:transcriptional regulator with XRE-family HTH domain
VPLEDSDELSRNIGSKISELRKQKSLTQQGLATLVQATVQWISRVERGQENLTLGTLAKVANALGVKVVDLFGAPKLSPRSVKRGRPRDA